MIETISRSRLVDLLRAGSGKRVAIIGDAMLDVYLHGDVDRISPEAPVPVVRVTERRVAPGGAANVAANVAAIGAVPILVCAIGSDQNGERLRGMLDDLSAQTTGMLAVDRPTTTKTRILARSQQVVRFDEENDDAITGREVALLEQAVRDAVATAEALVLEDYNKGVLVPSVITSAIAAAQKRGIPIIVDPKYKNFFSYKGATIFKPNRRELEAALGAEVELERTEALPETFRRLGVEYLLLTLGEQGMALLSADGEVGRIPTTAREVYDVVGAGDTVTAYLATMLAAGATPPEAAIVANFAAGVEVGKLGAATVTIDEVIEAFDSFQISGI
ncbi:MAG: D-glycero-beta-D-manno-heptose-7-phosphate kinase [Gemmatimonadaceae bacterium]|nr:D-glycero-beta-D-manno-heptose-7-phosphate kinase [Gemmatimonadaceae bacterium]